MSSEQRLKSSIYFVFQQFAAYFSCITTCLHLYWWKMCCKLLKNRADETLFTIASWYFPALFKTSVIFRFPKNLGNILYPHKNQDNISNNNLPNCDVYYKNDRSVRTCPDMSIADVASKNVPSVSCTIWVLQLNKLFLNTNTAY